MSDDKPNSQTGLTQTEAEKVIQLALAQAQEKLDFAYDLGQKHDVYVSTALYATPVKESWSDSYDWDDSGCVI